MSRLSVQLYSLRNCGPLSHQLDLVRKAGLDAVELTSSNYKDIGETRRLLEQHGLTAPSGHVGIERLRDEFAATVATARGFGVELLVLWGFPDEELWPDPEGWTKAGRALGAFSRRLADHGLRFAFHNHDWELIRFADGGVALDRLFDAARGTPLEWQADPAWLARGGADAGDWFERRGAILRSVHVKDLASPGTALDEDGWADLGQGRLDWTSWWPKLEARGVDLFVLEHDDPSDAERFLRVSASAARALAERR